MLDNILFSNDHKVPDCNDRAVRDEDVVILVLFQLKFLRVWCRAGQYDMDKFTGLGLENNITHFAKPLAGF